MKVFADYFATVLLCIGWLVITFLIMAAIGTIARAQGKCTPATSNAVIYDNATKQVVMIVKPDCEEQLDDPAFNPAGHTQVRLAKPVYNAGLKSAIEQLVPDVKLHLEPVKPPPPEPCKENCEPVDEEPIEIEPVLPANGVTP